ncbi:hypothetical protein [Bacillus swezeyi]|uniref:Uncharacterized protein n=1 Tax=Bacillus swezeyi TaxID=1925020 RepID=A0A5M8RXK1_9BACI|nr:hypothetical protein [Bacillus swezeyi]KAA6452023.1 hypothetical protein DX927_15100 [Bacillus swezeyi]KAA6473710.1 hypothetical protein DX928_20505 [Bacillus swezeyi]TYS36242.1 hypothetical protein FZC77_14535 [Bacillus swezeyi]
MKKQHRLLFSAIILLILCSAACYALYQHVAREAEQKGGAVLRQPAGSMDKRAVEKHLRGELLASFAFLCFFEIAAAFLTPSFPDRISNSSIDKHLFLFAVIR